MPKIVRIREGCKHGRADRPGSVKTEGDLYIASDNEVNSFSDKFVQLSHADTVEQISEFVAEKVIALAENDHIKARFLISLENEGRARSGVISALTKIIKTSEQAESSAE